LDTRGASSAGQMSETVFKRTGIGHIPALWTEPGASAESASRKLVIWLPGFSGDKESMRDALRDLAAAGFVGLSFDPIQHGERCTEGIEALRARVRGNIRRYFWPILAQTAEETPLII